MSSKRLLAKAFDVVFIVFFTLFYIPFCYNVIDIIFPYDVANTFATATELLANEPELYWETLSSHFLEFTVFYFVTFILLTFLLFFYFGIFGRETDGSIGKKLFKLNIINSDEENKVTDITALFMREPLVHVFLFNFILGYFVVFIPYLVMIKFLIIPVYLVLFSFEKDIWNSRMSIKVVSKGQTY